MEYAGALLWCMNQLWFCHCSSCSWRSCSSNIAEPPSSNFGYPFGLEEQIFYALPLKVTCVGISWMFTSFNQSFPMFEFEKSIRNLCFPMALSPQAVLRILCISEAGFPHLCKAYCKCIAFPNHLSENHRLHFICTKINTHYEAAWSCSCHTHQTGAEDSSTTAHKDRKLCHWLFLFLVASFRTSVYAFLY